MGARVECFVSFAYIHKLKGRIGGIRADDKDVRFRATEQEEQREKTKKSGGFHGMHSDTPPGEGKPHTRVARTLARRFRNASARRSSLRASRRAM